MAIWAGPYVVSAPEYAVEGIPYFKWIMFFGPLSPLGTALASFFVGRGEVKLVLWGTIWTNILNVLLDLILIFGVQMSREWVRILGFDWSIPTMGAKGAAIATGIAQLSYVLVLLICFLPPKYRIPLGTGSWKFQPKLFWQTIRIGLPTALSSIIEMGAWTLLAHQLAIVSEAHMTIFSIGDTFFALFAFGFVGLQQGVTTVAANYIGANQQEMLSKILHSGIKLILVVMLALFIPLYIFPEWLTLQFIENDVGILNDEMRHYAIIALRWVWLYFLFDGISWVTSGVLTAAGDTKFVMYMNSINAWCFAVLPTYVMITYFDGSPVISWVFCALYGLMNTISYFSRYKRKRWIIGQPLHVH
jgi:MATE family multidrug resistance protein